MITWESWRIPLLAAHVVCVAGACGCCAGALFKPGHPAGRISLSLLWIFLLGCAITGGMLYPAFETRMLWEKLGYTHGLGERLFRVKVHLAVTSLVTALLLPRLSRAVMSGGASDRLARGLVKVCVLLTALTLICVVVASGLIRHGGTH
ncbi:MAG TPA: hypothetical protein PLO53_12390 [Candidatus Hydrogenedentes bacterium]|nr:hypothetical protein [Candidatus Hydrogenedentota bacterium]HPU98735.1 hypothetical protein [Candidatus Hydrogenedentota bacterium]